MMNRDDLRLVVRERVDDARADYAITALTRAVSDAELAELGLMQRPACDYCSSNSLKKPEDCPSCGGSGFGRLMALTVEALSVAIEDATHTVGIEFEHYEQRVETCDALARQVLATLEAEAAYAH